MSSPACETCAFYDGQYCRRDAPRVIRLGHWAVVTRWPEVAADDWCGRYARRDPRERRIRPNPASQGERWGR